MGAVVSSAVTPGSGYVSGTALVGGSRGGSIPGTYDAEGRFSPPSQGESGASFLAGNVQGEAASHDSAPSSGDARTDSGRPPGVGTGSDGADEAREGGRGRDARAEQSAFGSTRLGPEAEAVIRKLRGRHNEVKAHYGAQAAAGGTSSGVAAYRYVVGPDGKRYATDGNVQFRLSDAGAPARRVNQARAVRMAALAPANADPSDLAVAAAAMRVELEARAAMRAELADEHARDVGRFTDPTAPDPEVSAIDRANRIENAAENVGSTYADELENDTFVNRPDYIDPEGAVRG